MGDDQILCPPEDLVNAALKFSDKALQVLSIHSDLDSFSQTLHDSLTSANARVSIDKFWSNWSKGLLNMAVEIENIAILLTNAAVAYLESDQAIMKAFHADQAAQDTINSEMDKIKSDKNTFDTEFNKEKQADDNLGTQQSTDQQNADAEDAKKKKEEDDAYYADENSYTATDG